MKPGQWMEPWTTARWSEEADERREDLLSVLAELERRGRRLARAPHQLSEKLKAQLPLLCMCALMMGFIWGWRKGAQRRTLRHPLPN